jgi:hypothetical protein
MTEKEAIDFFYDEAFVAFPGVLEWVNEKSPQPKETIKIWAKTIAKVTLEEAREVLTRWLDGDCSRPKPYEREVFAVLLRESVIDLRTSRNRGRALAEQQSILSEGGEKWSLATDNIYAKWPAIKERFDAGEITKAAALAEWNQILDVEFSKRGHR